MAARDLAAAAAHRRAVGVGPGGGGASGGASGGSSGGSSGIQGAEVGVRVRVLAVPGGSRADARSAAARAWPDLRRLCPSCGSGAHGRPRHADGRACSLAYAPGVALLATADDGRGVGVDVERDDERVPDLPGVLILADWVRLEAVAKATGAGLRGTDPSRLPPHRAVAVPLAGLVASVALLGSDAVPVLRVERVPSPPGGTSYV
ncbi:hypothetical protein [Nocardioides sp. GY 10127]|uniref:hypothetical protein n=1 Tax=Nocardioides sp. GY 10127 TaxID=2569762 RepID=UPI0010A8B7CD|nr:hypothetical protein [Nocardioides sp. GY 10127]TIC84159.1 hypothetical protein E8D37_04985 [Nocardioides sp. GY 10127]